MLIVLWSYTKVLVLQMGHIQSVNTSASNYYQDFEMIVQTTEFILKKTKQASYIRTW